MNDIRFYDADGEFGFLSNFWVGEPIRLRGHVFPSAEHLYQALKVGGDAETFAAIRGASTPMAAAAIGCGVRIRDDWDEVSLYAQRLVLLLKFEDTKARMLLLDTWGRALVELAPSYRGLGTLLMETRAFYFDLVDVSPHEEAAEISARQSELTSRLRTPKYKVVMP